MLKPHPLQNHAALTCEIHAASATQTSALSDIATLCARDVGLKLTVKIVRLTARAASTQTLVTLHLPVELAAGQHPAWCLACRLACFIPEARISVLIQGEQAFTADRSRTRRRIA